MSDQIHLVYGNINRTSFSFSISFPHSFRDDSNVLTFGIFASVPEINSFKESITYGIVGDSHCVSKHWVKIWYLHKGHKIVDNFDKESGLFLILWENLRRLVNDTVSFLIVLFDVLFHLINIGLMDQRVRVHHSDHNCIQIHKIFNQFWGHITSTPVYVGWFCFCFTWLKLMKGVRN